MVAPLGSGVRDRGSDLLCDINRPPIPDPYLKKISTKAIGPDRCAADVCNVCRRLCVAGCKRLSTGPGKTPSSTLAAASTAREAPSRQLTSGRCSVCGLVLPNTTRWNIQNRYQAANITTIAEIAPATQLARKAPSIDRNSPMKPLRPGNPTDPSIMNMNSAANKGI